MTGNKSDEIKNLFFLLCTIFIFFLSFLNHRNNYDWCILSLPIIIIILILVGTYRHFRFTTFTYFMMLIYLIMLIIGTTYSYTANPLFQVVKEQLHLTRNHYDRLTHLAFGFFPIFVLKEFLFSKKYLRPSKMSYSILVFIILAFAAIWELLEFAATVISHRSAAYMLSLQGDTWDTQWDMLLALIGASAGLLFFNKVHDKIMQVHFRKVEK